MSRKAIAASFVLLAASAASCGSPPDPVQPTPPPATPIATAAPAAPTGPRAVTATLESVGLDGSALDRNADPCNDFYRFSCGGWLDKTPIPADKPAYARSFSVIADRNEADLRSIVEDAAAGKIATPAGKKVGALYSACTDLATIESLGVKPLEPMRKFIRAVHDEKSLGTAVAELHKIGTNVFFAFSQTQDFKDAQKVIGQIDQSGLGLPDRDFYLRDDPKSKSILSAYADHVERLSGLAGANAREAKSISADVLRIETALAKMSKTNVERRDVKSLYNKIDRAGVLASSKQFPWAQYLDAMAEGSLTDINVTNRDYLPALDKILHDEKAEAIRHYLDWHLVSGMTSALPKKLDDERFSFVQVLTGQPKQRERWKRCISATDDAIGELLAQPYLEKRFDGESKAAADKMIGAIRQVFGEDLAALTWMDDQTKARAAEKLKAISFQIGYPVKWRSYDFDVDAKSYANDLFAAHRWETARELAKIGKPLDKDDWQMTPPTVNAYADPQEVLMVFPAGILQPPFFSKTFSPAVNLGGIGMVIGHELTHHFDDQGSEYSALGNVESWWSPDVKTKFEAKGTCVADQYSGYEASQGVKLNGRLTLGENIADIGGAKMAFAAYKKLRAGALETTVADGFSEDQQFFLAMGQSWCTQIREEYARTLAQTDPHSLAKYRIDGSLADVSQFADAFQCKVGSAMHPKAACEVW